MQRRLTARRSGSEVGPQGAWLLAVARRSLPVFAELALLVALVRIGGNHANPLAAESVPPPGKPSRDVMWRFDGGGRFPKIHPPSEWHAEKNILWKTPVDAGGYSSPIVAANRVFLTAEMGSLICLNLADGKLLWTKDLFSEDSQEIPADLSKNLMRGCGGDSKQSTPTPTSNGQLVFYINAMGLCACYDLDGNRKWIRVIETAEDEEQFTSSPIFVGDRIVLSWGCLLALNANDGSTLWKATPAKSGNGTPTITRIGGVEVVITPGGEIVRLQDGEILCSKLFKPSMSTPLVEDNTLYVVDATSRAFQLPAKAERGMRPSELWATKLSGEFMASPAFADGLLYTIENGKCRLNILDAKTGEVLTSHPAVDPETKVEETELGVKIDGLTRALYAYASPTASRDQLFCFDDSGSAAVLALGRKYQPVRVNKLNDACIGTPFFIDDRIIIRGRETVYCVGAKREPN